LYVDARLFPSCHTFDAFEVDLRAGELYQSGPQNKTASILPFQALALLLERPGEVSRGEFEKSFGPETPFGFDHSLISLIKKLRQALGDDNKKPRFVETLPKRGYRFHRHR